MNRLRPPLGFEASCPPLSGTFYKMKKRIGSGQQFIFHGYDHATNLLDGFQPAEPASSHLLSDARTDAKNSAEVEGFEPSLLLFQE